MKLSTLNRLPGTITEVIKGEAAAKVTLQVGDNHVVSLITRESADELDLEPGKSERFRVTCTKAHESSDKNPMRGARGALD